MRFVCVDMGFLLAVYDSTEEAHGWAVGLFRRIFEEAGASLLAPWPVLYETLNTRFARRREQVALLDRDLRRLNGARRLSILSDTRYRDNELTAVFTELERGKHYRPLSLVDRVLRRMLVDESLNVHGFVTLDPGDFADACRVRNCELMTR